ncbi:Hypothetical Protein FCC1311_084512 [Hondaea fermentalgiana]|uniref:t-SNARE coiled-coil homology domain-containing protein n=1 Tax=Hondaea fermentalgiana TaxID=2315210 RepID=A0A2R5GMV9_9STRA|nr:Hypothetical Protein FCC1311_084512 [Hondaea fermentalgiana]|eukprot:GBG32226.1 Hypothetical Protein FCC1311_084512 [Hondaea fermentalgiana]
MDVTETFWAAVDRAETALQRRAARRPPEATSQGQDAPGTGRRSFAADSLESLRKLVGAQETIAQVAEAYATFTYSTSSASARGLTDRERDAFDARLASVVGDERAKVDALRNAVQAMGAARPDSALAHQQAAVHRLYEILQNITKASGELQLLRLRHTTSSRTALYASAADDGSDAHKTHAREQDEARIARLVKEAQQSTSFDPDADDDLDIKMYNAQNRALRHRRRKRVIEEEPQEDQDRRSPEVNHANDVDTARHDSRAALGLDVADASDHEDVMEQAPDQALMQALESEQTALQSRLDSELEAVKKAETQMNEFSQMLSFFNDKIVEQSEFVDNIFKDVQTSTIFMDMSTEQLLSAKSHSSNFRRNVILFFAIASGLLLLLDAMD